MKPKSQETSGQSDLFNTPLADLLNSRHELYQLANLIDWQTLDKPFGQFFTEANGAPALATRLIAGLHYLKHAFAVSDEDVVARWAENPYWQYFCGEESFRHQMPCHPTSLTKWRNRIGEEGCRQHLVRLAGHHQLSLRQNYNRKAPYLLMMTNRYNHANQMKRKRKTLKQLKTLVGRVCRDIERQLPAQSVDVQVAFKDTLAKTQRILAQQRQDKNRPYSVHAPEVECIAKGKGHKKYEFGVKVGITVTNRSNFVLGARSFPGNPYDGHILESCLEQAEILSGIRAKEASVDLGYRGVDVPNVTIYKARQNAD